MARARRCGRAATVDFNAGGTDDNFALPDPLLNVPEVSPTDARRIDQSFVQESFSV